MQKITRQTNYKNQYGKIANKITRIQQCVGIAPVRVHGYQNHFVEMTLNSFFYFCWNAHLLGRTFAYCVIYIAIENLYQYELRLQIADRKHNICVVERHLQIHFSC